MGPAGAGVVLLLVVQEVGVELPDDVVLVSKHEEPGGGGVPLPVGADAGRPDLQQEVPVVQHLPDVSRAGEPHPLPVAAEALLIEHGHVHLVQHPHVLGLHRGVPLHGPGTPPGCSGSPPSPLRRYVHRGLPSTYTGLSLRSARGTLMTTMWSPSTSWTNTSLEDRMLTLVRLGSLTMSQNSRMSPSGSGRSTVVEGLVRPLLHAQQNDCRRGCWQRRSRSPRCSRGGRPGPSSPRCGLFSRYCSILEKSIILSPSGGLADTASLWIQDHLSRGRRLCPWEFMWITVRDFQILRAAEKQEGVSLVR